MIVALLGTLAHATPVVTATLTPGVSAAAVANARTPVPVLTFVDRSLTWTVACRGSARMTCTVTSPGQAAGDVLSATATTLVLSLGGQDIEVRAPSSPVSFASCAR